MGIISSSIGLFNPGGVKISCEVLSNGKVVDEEEDKGKEAEKYFQEILSPSGHQPQGDGEWQPDTTLMEEQESLTKKVDDEEVKAVIWNSKEGIAPGPDGFTLSFFKSAWEVVGKEIIQAIKFFFQTGRLLRETNATFITSIPKVLDVDSLKDYRQFSL